MKQYPHHIGDIEFDKTIDKENFQACNDLMIQHWERYEVSYQGDTKQIEQEIRNEFNPKKTYESFSGLIIVKFIINCKSEVGRFRYESLDLSFMPQLAPSGLGEELCNSVRSLDGWNPIIVNGKHYDSYMYLTIKFEDGLIEQVFPLI